MAASAFSQARRSQQDLQVMVVKLPKSELERIDQWGVTSGKASRTATVRELIAKGLAAASHDTEAA